MSRITDAVRQKVRQRADNRCEYCLSHQNYVMGRLQIDHIMPVARGGSNDEDNLCLACELCNGHKWAKTEAIDAESEKTSFLFNPRLQKWEDHFVWSANGIEVVGVTPIGRATIITLRMNDEPALTVRRYWVRAGWHPPKI